MKIKSIIKTFGPAMEMKYRNKILPGHKKAMVAMLKCRTEDFEEVTVRYFLVTVTVPYQLRDPIWRNQKKCYDRSFIIFTSSSIVLFVVSIFKSYLVKLYILSYWLFANPIFLVPLLVSLLFTN